MFEQLIMCVRGESRITVIRQCVDAYLEARGEPGGRDIDVDRFQFGRRVWLTLSPPRDEKPSAELMAGGLGFRRLCLDLKERAVVRDLAQQ